MTKQSSLKGTRITEIEGLRAVLALWVFFCHVILYCGYPRVLPGPIELFRAAWHAVDIFIIIAGFAMWYALDHSNDKYFRYLGKRFFRLFPLMFLLFLVAIPIAKLEMEGAAILGQTASVTNIQSWFDNMWAHIGLHAVMLHGVIPKASSPSGAPWAFLPPAWFVSYVWQFYLVAPFLFMLNKSQAKFITLGFGCATIVWFRHYLPPVGTGAFLPFHIEYLFIGACSYKLFKLFADHQWRIPFPLTGFALMATLLLFPQIKDIFLWDELDLNKDHWWLPLSFWAIFFCVVLDSHFGKLDWVSKALRSFLNSKAMQWVGTVSYSFYLVHALVQVTVRWAIVKQNPEISQLNLAMLIIGISMPISLALAAPLFKYVELGGAKLGKKIMG